MDIQTIAGIVFIVLLVAVLVIYRKNVKIQSPLFPLFYVALYRTRWGLRLMSWIGKRWTRAVHILANIGSFIGIIGLCWISVEVLTATVRLFVHPDQMAALQPVLPIPVKGVFFVPFIYWILTIFVIAVVHEVAHGIVARAWKVPVKSSGFAVFGIIVPIIPAAFVEPDEKVVSKMPLKVKLGIFAAGPFSNILLAALVVLLFGFSLPGIVPERVTNATAIVNLGGTIPDLVTVDYLQITNISADSPAARAGLMIGENITAVNGMVLSQGTMRGLNGAIAGFAPGETVSLVTESGTTVFTLAPHPSDATKGYMGVAFDVPPTHPSVAAVAQYGEFGVAARMAITTFLAWLFLLSLGIGLFNLLPLGPIDGGRMLDAIASRFLPSKVARAVVWTVSIVFLIAIILNLVISFVR